jgi:hypothetical protein
VCAASVTASAASECAAWARLTGWCTGGAVTGAAVWNHCGVPRRRQALTLPSSIVIVAIPSLESQKLVSSVVPSRLG